MSTFWQDKRVVVTGGAGFLGSFVVERIRNEGARVVVSTTWSTAVPSIACWPTRVPTW